LQTDKIDNAVGWIWKGLFVALLENFFQPLFP